MDCVLIMVIPHHINNECYLPYNYFNQLEIINDLQFTSREIDVISCIISLRGSSKIASILNISPRTAESHIANIKRKIDNNSREGIVDFIEKSGKTTIIRTHYQYLLVMANFNKKLQAIFTIIKNTGPIVCYLVTFCTKDQEFIIKKITKDLSFAGIKLITLNQSQIKSLEPQQNEHFVYIISKQFNEQSNIFKLFKQFAHQSNFYTIVAIDTIDPDILKKLNKNRFVSFTEQKNYYLTIFEIIKKILPNIELVRTILQFKSYNQTIITQPESIAELSSSVIKTNQSNTNLEVQLPKNQKWLIMLALLAITNIIFIFGYNKMVSREYHQIASYMPEILTGHEKFVGREKELQQIKKFLHDENMIIITGCAGIGKSSLAIEYGKRYKQNKIVRYFHAASKIKLDQQYQELAQELNINIEQQSTNLIMQFVNNKLSTLKTKVLFVFDNVDQYDDIKEYVVNLPTNIQTILTTRQPMLITHKPHLVLQEFSKQEAMQYLKSSLQNKHFNETLIQEAIENTGTLPYDIKCVAAYLLDNPSIDSQTDLSQLGNKFKNKLFYEFITNPNKTKQQAWKILQYAANLDPDFISIELINKLLPENIELSLNALKILNSLSLISISNNKIGQAGFRIHRNLQKNIQNTTKNHAKHIIDTQKLLENLLEILNKSFPELTFNSNFNQQTIISLQPHIEKLLNLKIKPTTENGKINLADLYYKSAASYYMTININYYKALEYAKIALNQQYALYKINHHVANSLNIIGVIYRKIGNTQEALKYLTKGLKIRQLLYPGNHPDVANSFHTIGTAYNQHGEPQKGLKYSQMALEMNRQLYSDNSYEIGCDLNAVGINYLDLGNFEKSIEYFKASLKTFTELNPANHEKMAALQSNIAYNYNKMGRHLEALNYAQASVSIFKQLYPDGHPRAIYSLDDLGDSLIKTNNVKQGLKVLHQALSLSEKFNMNNHCITAFVLHDLGRGYFKSQNHQKALEYTEKALVLRKEMYSSTKNHPELAESLHNLAAINLALGNKNAALQLYKDALNMYIALSLEHLPEPVEIKQKIQELDSV